MVTHYQFYVLYLVPLLLVAKEVQLFPDVGLYSGIFAIFLQFPLTKSRTANVVFYVLCLLYVLSAAPFICDSLRIGVSDNSTCENIIFISYACADSNQSRWTIISTSNWVNAIIKSHYDCPKHSKCMLWLHLTMHHSAHIPFNLYLSPVLFN